MALAVDNTGDALGSTLIIGGTVTESFLTGSGSNRLLIVSISTWDNGGTAGGCTTVTYGLQSMSLLSGSPATNGAWYTEQWVLVAPTSGTANIIATVAGTTTKIGLGTISFTGADQTTGIDTNSSATGTSGTVTKALTLGATNEYMVDAMSHNSANTSSSRTNTSIYEDATSGTDTAAQYGSISGSGSQSMSWTMPDPGDAWAYSVLAVKSASSSVNATVTQVGASVTATGGTQAVAAEAFATVAQAHATLTATAGTQVATTNATIAQSHATLTVTGGTQSVAAVGIATVLQVGATLTATGGTQAVVAEAFATVSQVGATLTVTGGTQSVGNVQGAAISQVHVALTITTGTQAVVAANSISVIQVAASLAVTGGTQSLATGTPSVNPPSNPRPISVPPQPQGGRTYTKTSVDIYSMISGTLTYITSVRQFSPLSSTSILQYSKELSDFGQCKFRISSYDPMFKQYGDILQPHVNHIRINRGGTLVWSGAIIENDRRTKDYVEVVGAEYEWYLNKLLVQRSGTDIVGGGPTLTPSTFTMSGYTATLNFSSSILNQMINNIATGVPVSIGQTVTLAGFSPGNLNGQFEITAFTSTQLTLNLGGGPYSASTIGTVEFSDNIYRIFNCDTMGAQIGYMMNEVIAQYQNSNGLHPLANMTIGTIQTPNYPANITNNASVPGILTGPYIFGNGTDAPQMNFDFHSILYVLQSMGKVSYADFQVDENLVFDYVIFLGQDNHYDVNFTYGQAGNAVDFNWPRLGQQQVNDLLGIATDINGVVLHAEQTDQTSITNSGLLQQVASYADIKDQATLNAAVQAEIPLISNSDQSPITFTLDEKAYPLGVYDIGDIVTCAVNTDYLTIAPVSKRIVGITVNVNNQGREMSTVQLNNPLPGQLGSVGTSAGGF